MRRERRPLCHGTASAEPRPELCNNGTALAGPQTPEQRIRALAPALCILGSFSVSRSLGSVSITMMHGKHVIDFIRPVAELAAGVLVTLCFLADAPKNRKANVSATGRVEFAPGRRATVAWLILAAFSVTVIPAQFRRMGGDPFSIVIPVAIASVAISLLTSFPGSILIDSEGMQQRFWAWKNKRIRWTNVVEINTGEKSRTVTISGADGTKIVHSRQLPDRPRLLWELKRHCGEQLPADFPREPVSGSA